MEMPVWRMPRAWVVMEVKLFSALATGCAKWDRKQHVPAES